MIGGNKVNNQPEVKEKKQFFLILAEFFFIVYMISLNVFVLKKDTLIISQFAFIFFAGFGALGLLIRQRFYIGKTVALAYLACTWFFATYFWAQNGYIALIKIKTMWQVMVLFFIVYNVFYENKNAHAQFIRAIYIAGISLCIYSVYVYGIDGIIDGMTSGRRLGKEIGQENIYGMNLATTAIIGFYYFFYKKGNRIFHLAVVASSFILAMSSGSRKALLMVIFGCFYLVIKEYGFRRIYKIVIVLLVLILVFNMVIQLPIFNLVRERMEMGMETITGSGNGDKSAGNRIIHIERGFNLFKEKPFVGYGADNYRVASGSGTYSHNNFIEVLVDFGVIGFLIYYSMYVRSYKNLSSNKTPEGNLIFVLFLIRTVLEVAVVTYFDKLQWIYLAFFMMMHNRDVKGVPVIEQSKNKK